jgi:hypothetical protein
MFSSTKGALAGPAWSVEGDGMFRTSLGVEMKLAGLGEHQTTV